MFIGVRVVFLGFQVCNDVCEDLDWDILIFFDKEKLEEVDYDKYVYFLFELDWKIDVEIYFIMYILKDWLK